MSIIRPPTEADGTLILSLSERDDVVAPGSSASVTIDDAVVTQTTPATTDTAFDIATAAVHFTRPVSVSLSCSATGSISSGRLTRVSDGPCTLVATSGMFIKSQVVTMLRQAGQTVNAWQSWVAGSLAATIDQTTDVDLPFWRGDGFGFTAISPRHVIGCEHINFMPETLTLGGVTLSLVGSQVVGPLNSVDAWKSDLMIGLYDGDFPSFAKVFPSDLFDYLPSLSLKAVPAILCNKSGEKIQRLTGIYSSAASKLSLVKINAGDTNMISGDSGNPAFLVVDGEPVLLGTLTGGGGGSVTTIHDQIALINSAMAALGGGHQLTQFDLSWYPNYA